MTDFGSSALPPVDPITLPAEVRNGSAQDKKSYQAALGFERMLLGEMTKAMVNTANPTDDGSSDGSSSDGSSSDGSDSTSSDAATSLYMSMLPDQLADAMVANGGVGLAQSFYDASKPADATKVSGK